MKVGDCVYVIETARSTGLIEDSYMIYVRQAKVVSLGTDEVYVERVQRGLFESRLCWVDKDRVVVGRSKAWVKAGKLAGGLGGLTQVRNY